jgi:hypothetical protein
MRSVRPSGRKQQLSTHLTDFHEILYFNASKHGGGNLSLMKIEQE